MSRSTRRRPLRRWATRASLATACAVIGLLPGIGPPAWAQVPRDGVSSGARAALPQRNLLIEFRHGEAAVLEDADPFAVRSTDAQGSSVQQLWVLNGQQGLLRTGLTVPVQWYQTAWTPDGPALVEGRSTVDTSRSVGVRVRWPGGQAPATVELRSEASALAGGGSRSRHGFDGQPLPEGAVESAGLLSTLQIPLGRWLTVGGSVSSDAVRAGEFGTRELRSARQDVLQLRITAP